MELLCGPPHGSPQFIGNSKSATAEQSRETSGGYATSSVSDGDVGEGEGEGGLMESMLRSAWGDLQRRQRHTTRDEAQYTAANFGGKDLAATLEVPVYNRELDANVSTFGGNGCNDMFPRVEESGAVSIVSPPVCCGEIEDQAMSKTMLERHQDGWADSSFIDTNRRSISNSVDISQEDWLHVAKDFPPNTFS